MSISYKPSDEMKNMNTLEKLAIKEVDKQGKTVVDENLLRNQEKEFYQKHALSVPLRTDADRGRKNYGKFVSDYTLTDEWLDDGTDWGNRDKEKEWESRYEFESNLIVDIMKRTNIPIKSVLELGSGPGKLSQHIQEKLDFDVDYTLIDKENAKKRFEKRKYKGNFVVKDLFNSFDTSGLENNYDWMICNDFLEHIANPSDCVSKLWSLSHKDSRLVVSVPNWRSAHNWIYRGLFDYDNFKHFMVLHGFTPIAVTSSQQLTPDSERLSSEISCPPEYLNAWNWYFFFRPIGENEDI